MDYIKRAIEDMVSHSDKTFKSILITGARQTGKTKMIKELFPDKSMFSLTIRSLRIKLTAIQICL